jgi:nitroreductase
MTGQMRAGLARSKSEGKGIGSAKYTLKVMEQAPVTVLIFYPGRPALKLAQSIDQHLHDVVEIQSIGAAIQNMLLAAWELGVGSVWICDIFSAYQELSNWLGESAEMIAAVSFGYADEHPIARKRKAFDTVVHWK